MFAEADFPSQSAQEEEITKKYDRGTSNIEEGTVDEDEEENGEKDEVENVESQYLTKVKQENALKTEAGYSAGYKREAYGKMSLSGIVKLDPSELETPSSAQIQLPNNPAQNDHSDQLPAAPIPKPIESTFEWLGTIIGKVIGLNMFGRIVSQKETVILTRHPNPAMKAIQVEKEYDVEGESKQIGFLDQETGAAVHDIISQTRLIAQISTLMDDHKQAIIHIKVYSHLHHVSHIQNYVQSLGVPFLPTNRSPSSTNGGDDESNGYQSVTLEHMESDVDKLFEQQIDSNMLQQRDPHSSVVANLFPYQKQALAWMFSCEANTRTLSIGSSKTQKTMEPHRGGILADDMGLGKTLQMISLVASTSRAAGFPPQGGFSCATLIVCPLSVITNWQNQFYTHVQSGRLTLCTYHGPDRHEIGNLSRYDVVITTYNIVSTEYREVKDGGPLFGMKWRRIVLDEAHIIRDKKTLQCQAVCELEAERRWCATGTPIQNKIEDFFALLKFLRVEPFTSHDLWNKLIMRPLKNRNPKGLERLQTILGAICLRRKKTDKVGGKNILPSLPPKKIKILALENSGREKELYENLMVNGRTQLIRQRQTGIQHSFLLEMILRMRQVSPTNSICGCFDFPCPKRCGDF